MELSYRDIYKSYFGAIPKGWVVHHIDHIKKNNDIINLISMPKEIHNSYHFLWAHKDSFTKHINIDMKDSDVPTSMMFEKYMAMALKYSAVCSQIQKAIQHRDMDKNGYSIFDERNA